MSVIGPRFDALDPAVLDDPYPVYAELRQAGALCRVRPAMWGVTRHAEVAALLRDPRLGNRLPNDDPQFAMDDDLAATVFGRIIPTRDVEGHGRLRRLLLTAFAPAAVRRLQHEIGVLVDELLAPALESGRLDAIADLAFPLAATVVCRLVGLPDEARGELWPRAAALSRAFTPFLPEGERAVADEALRWLRGYVGDLVEERRAAPVPGEDLLSRLVAACADDDGLGPDDVVDNIAFICFTGFETTMNMVSTGCVALAAAPGELDRLREDPRLVPSAVEEFARYDAPIQYTVRLTLEPVEVGGRTIRAGRPVVLLLGSANRDERQFRDPDRLDVGRRPNAHVSYGGGPRGCLGAALARVEGTAAFERLAGAVERLEPAGEEVRHRSVLFRTFESVPLAVRPARHRHR